MARRWVGARQWVVIALMGAAVLAGTVASGAFVAEATPTASGSYLSDSIWSWGPYASSDASHIAYTNSPAPLQLFSGLTIIMRSYPERGQGSPDRLAATATVVETSAAVSGITNAIVTWPRTGDRLQVICETPDVEGGYCSVPSGSYTITIGWTMKGYTAECYYDWLANGGPLNCEEETVSDTVTRTVVSGLLPQGTTTTLSTAPTAAFDAQPSATDRFEFAFTSTSTDDQDELAELDHLWNFGDGATSTELNPTFRFDRAGTFPVTLTVTDTSGKVDSVTHDVTIAAGLVVNSTGDAPAVDPDVRGCDTGQLVGDDPECTLRAAVEVANAKGGGDISFAIEGTGTPSIAIAEPLPALTGPSSIDGTTQGSGWVEVVGGGERALEFAAGPSTVRGLIVSGAASQILVTGGAGTVVEGNRLGTDASGTASAEASSTGLVVSGSSGVRVADNVFGNSNVGVVVATDAPGATIEGNTVGVAEDGTTPLGEIRGGVIVAGPDANVRDNVVRGRSVGIELLGSAASGSTVADNHVGINRPGTAAFGGQGYGIRTDGAPRATITGNRVQGEAGAIVLSGTNSTSSRPDGIELERPGNGPPDGAVTGTVATVEDNDIGVLVGASTAIDGFDTGIVAWSGMADVDILGNRVAGSSSAAISLLGGSRFEVAGNQLGTDAAGQPTLPVGSGVEVEDASDVTIGTVAGPNSIAFVLTGIDADGATGGLRIEGNTTIAPPAGTGVDNADHILVGEAAEGAVVTGNRMVNGAAGIRSEAPHAHLTGNTVLATTDLGIGSTGASATVSGSVVVGLGDAIRVEGDGVTVNANRVGLEEGSDKVIGNDGVGLTVAGGRAEVAHNEIAGTTDVGIAVTGGTATLRANRVWQNGGKAIAVADGPAAPKLVAASRTGSGADTRTVLLLTGLLKGDAGRLEVFANADCSSPEAELLMDINRTKAAKETERIIVIKGASTRDHFTVTYTDQAGRTSELSGCADATEFADGDGDGSVDPFDSVLGFDNDPTRAMYPTDDERLLLAVVPPADPTTGVGGGHLDNLRFVGDPDPGSHPAGWSMPWGIVDFRISGIEPGGRTRVVFGLLDPDDPFPSGTAYWKYGPRTPGAAPTWWNFGYDPASDTGAVLSDAVNVPGVGVTRALVLSFADGARGDADGGANGTITDPGGPVLAAPTDEPGSTTTTVPATTSTTSAGVAATSTTSAGPAATAAVSAGASERSAAVLGSTEERPLARTGTESVRLVLPGLAAVLAGIVLLVVRRRASRP